MPLLEIRVPHLDTYNFGVGVDRLSGTAMNLAVNPTPSSPEEADGGDQSFTVTRIIDTHDLQQKLGIDANASYGCASFGAGISARFNFSQESKVHSESLFMAITRTIHLADLSIPECILSSSARSVFDHPDVFAARYGNMFLRACRRGGLFVGLLRVETFAETDASKIESELKGSYGLFSASAAVNFSKITSDYKASVYCSIYTEGGPTVTIDDPTDPKQLLNAANVWATAMGEHPDTYSKPYQWTLSPLTIAEAPLPLNEAEIQHAQDVLQFCAQQRPLLFDRLNQFNWWSLHQDKYDWTNSATPEQIVQAVAATQSDLDTVASCASEAINNPRLATMPSDFAATLGKKYPISLPGPIGPKARPGTPLTLPDTTSAPSPTGLKGHDRLDPRIGRLTHG
jgi:hypothetical protein